jgi:hypothetical protein
MSKKYKVRFVLKQFPKNSDEADLLSRDVILKFGSEGWQLVSTEAITQSRGAPALLLSFQKEESDQ